MLGNGHGLVIGSLRRVISDEHEDEVPFDEEWDFIERRLEETLLEIVAEELIDAGEDDSKESVERLMKECVKSWRNDLETAIEDRNEEVYEETLTCVREDIRSQIERGKKCLK